MTLTAPAPIEGGPAQPGVLTNPVVPGFHPDPSVCRVDGTYYLACSTFEFLPGIPLFRSDDLVTWTPVGHVVTRAEQLDVRDVPTAGGAWAPTIRHHDGRFHVVVTDAMGRGNLLFTADDPAGEWSDGTVVEGIDGIDPDLAWDADGTCYLTYSGLLLGEAAEGGVRHLGIQQVRFDVATGRALEEPRSLWSGTGGIFPEAPHLYEVDGTWYLLVAEGGTERGHAVSIARGPTPEGPFEDCPANPLLTARGTDRPVQNTGHADLFQTPDGGWAMVLLGVRPRGMVRSFSPMGRETFATRLRWEDGWPVVEPVELGPQRPPVRVVDDFDGTGLDLPWVSVRRPATEFSTLTARPGWLVLHGDGSTMDDPRPVFVGRRQQHEVTEVTAVVDASAGVGGLSVRIDEDNHVDLEIDGDVVRARAVLARVAQTWQVPAPAGPVTLRLETVPPAEGFSLRAITCDLVRLSVDTPTGRVDVAEVDGRGMTAETAGSFTGRVVGVYATTGTVAVDRISYQGQDRDR
ncbi:glycoside hydrolase family 43 protein [Paenibacillus sp. TRM 82003]|uniref:glycoside hydrolase family 43 protein n=1 Tax=Kineococcus sp. TRM81007 TaxID=2925831 RepID=UPI001F5880E4|nr:glycoside hydrolase family 43 protein [Kineococcus sp. TRM81007]MCI2237758.1 glycoside hydrolase family 43 protein [Kineococcus sp. TRM81007]MCI3921776.1 glycoside hydrolase family 43 protein [Paenibacillus sp. TRM 82003]